MKFSKHPQAVARRKRALTRLEADIIATTKRISTKSYPYDKTKHGLSEEQFITLSISHDELRLNRMEKERMILSERI